MKRFIGLLLILIMGSSSSAYALDSTYVTKVGEALSKSTVYIDPDQSALNVNEIVELIDTLSVTKNVYVAVVPSTVVSNNEDLSSIAGAIGATGELNGVVLVLSESGGVSSSNVLGEGGAQALLLRETGKDSGFAGYINFIKAADQEIKIVTGQMEAPAGDTTPTTIEGTTPTPTEVPVGLTPDISEEGGEDNWWLPTIITLVVIVIAATSFIRGYYDNKAKKLK